MKAEMKTYKVKGTALRFARPGDTEAKTYEIGDQIDLTDEEARILEANLEALDADGLAALAADKDQLAEKLATAEQQLKDALSQNESLKTDLAKAQTDLAAVQAANEDLAADLKQTQSDFAASGVENDKLKADLQKALDDLEAAQKAASKKG